MIDSFIPGQWYTNGVKAFQVLGIEDGRVHLRFQGESETRYMTERTLANVVWVIDEPPEYSPPNVSHVSEKTASGKKKASRLKSEKTYTTQETSPVIIDLIRKNGRASGEYLTHEEIVQLILGDPKGGFLIDQAIRRGNRDTPQGIAESMLEQFSAAFTREEGRNAGDLERVKVDDKYDYRPKLS